MSEQEKEQLKKIIADLGLFLDSMESSNLRGSEELNKIEDCETELRKTARKLGISLEDLY